MISFFGLDLDRSSLEAFVEEYFDHKDPNVPSWPTENLKAQSFNYDTVMSDLSVADEVRGPFMEAYRLLARIPGMPEVQEPIWARALQTWSEHVLNGAIDRSWNGCWDAHMILHFYRQFTSVEHRTDTHMKAVYVAITAFSFCTMQTVVLDDVIDESSAASRSSAWHSEHPRSFSADAAFIGATGNRILHYILPDSHPCKRDLIQVYNDYNAYCASYICVTAARRQRSPEEAIRRTMHMTMDNMTREAGTAFQTMRGGLYVAYLFKFAQLLACYQNILSTCERRNFWADTSVGMIMVLGVVEDIRDSKTLDIQVPCGLSLDQYMDYVTDEMTEEFVSGDPHSAFLWASLEIGRGEATWMNLTSHEREEIMKTLKDCFWVNPENFEDAESKKKRLYRLCAMFLKYEVRRYIKENLLRQETEKYFLIQNKAVGFNMPHDMLSYALGSMVCQEEHSRPAKVAAKIQEIMTAPITIMDEREKVFCMLNILQNL